MKKLTAWTLVLCMMLSLLGAMPVAAEDRPVITIARPSEALIEDMDTNATTLFLEEKFNVDIQFMEFPKEDAAAKLAVLINSGSELPDVINIELDSAAIASYANKGVLLPLDDYLNNPEMMKNFYSPYYEYPEGYAESILGQLKNADGHSYSLPYVSCGAWNQSPVKMFINVGWIEKLNLEMPTTADELKEVLKAFVTQDPNGNGKADEIGIIGGEGWPCCDIVAYLLGAFTANTYTDNYYYAEDGKVKAAFIEDGFRQGLEYAHSLVEEGLIYPASFTQDATQFKAIAASEAEDYTVGMIAARSDSGIGTDYFFENFEMLEPMAGPEGMKYAVQTPPTVVQRWFVTTSCENPELAFAIGEYGYDPEMCTRERYGIKGVNWTDDPEIVKNYGSRMPGSAWEPVYAVLDDTPWTTVANVSWRQSLPFTGSDASLSKTGIALKTPDEEKTPRDMFNTYYMTLTANTYSKYAYPNTIGHLVYTEDENFELADITTAINTYRAENITRFVTGSRDLAEWDSYVKELNAMGLEVQLEYMQRAYDRANGK